MWILKAQTLKTVELILEGCPSQDTLVGLEQAEDEKTEELLDSELGAQFIPVSPPEVKPKFYTRSDEEDDVWGDGDEGWIGGREGWRAHADLQELAACLGRDAFRVVLYRVLVGDQVVVRGQDASLIRRIILSLMCLIPRGCARPVYFSREYREPFVCNLLGLHAEASVSEQQSEERDFLFLILLPPEEDGSVNTDETLMGRSRFKLQTATASPRTLPQVDPSQQTTRSWSR